MSLTPEQEAQLLALLTIARKKISDLEASPSLTDDMLAPVENATGTFAASMTKFKNYFLSQKATNTTLGVSYLPNPVGLTKNSSTTINYLAGTFRTSAGTQIYLPAMSKIIQSSGSWNAGNNQNGLDGGVRTSNTFYFTWVIQNNSTLAYDYLISTSSTSPIIPSGYTNLGIMDYGLIRVNGSNNIANAVWHPNDKQIILGAGEAITIVNSTAGAGNVSFITSTLPIEFGVRTYLGTTTTGGSDFAVYGSEQDSTDSLECLTIGTNNGFFTHGGGSIYTSDGKIYWKNFSTSGGVSSQICKVKSIKIRS